MSGEELSRGRLFSFFKKTLYNEEKIVENDLQSVYA
jgi:hypothetical protein